MIYCFVGHRGVGKSQLLSRLRSYFPESSPSQFYDLDEVVEKNCGLSISSLFATKGEDEFRRLEEASLQDLLAELSALPGDHYIAVGAGFSGTFPAGAHVIWVRRPTDRKGRVFLDRPRLEATLSPLEEAQQLFSQREAIYRTQCHEVLQLLEGYDQSNKWEKDWLLNNIRNIGGILVVDSKTVETWRQRPYLLEKRLQWGPRYFELRDDLLSAEQTDWLIEKLPLENILLSLRRPSSESSFLWDLVKDKKSVFWDFPLEMNPEPNAAIAEAAPIISAHDRTDKESIADFLTRLQEWEKEGRWLKAAPLVHDFKELLIGHRWALERPSSRSFLPRSKDGRWLWYRMITKDCFPLQFWRESDSLAVDQPSLLQWLRMPKKPWEFAAVLGDPVEHSRSPAFHEPFFSKVGLPFVAIPLNEEDWQQGAAVVLWEMGLRYAAVTSPLKKLASEVCQVVSKEADRYGSINTLIWDMDLTASKPEQDQPWLGGWRGENTDIFGLDHLLRTTAALRGKGENLVVWGGGGTKPLLQALLPKAQFYSARRGQCLQGNSEVMPEVVVWAVSRSRDFQWPSEQWKPAKVIDLSYEEDSPGREYAERSGAQYTSGWSMFKVQAEKQQQFWVHYGR